jgi:hypothetical protein
MGFILKVPYHLKCRGAYTASMSGLSSTQHKSIYGIISHTLRIFGMQVPAVFVFTLIIAACSCSSVSPVRPIEKGESLVSMSSGGPIVTNEGFPVPLANVVVDYEYGLLDNLTIGGNLHLVPIFFGVIYQSEVHGLYAFNEGDGLVPSVPIGLNVFVRTDFRESFLVLPEFRIIPSWKLCDSVLFFVGASCMLNPYPRTAGLEKTDYLLFSFPLGFELGIADFSIAAELKILDPFAYNKGLLFDYVGLGDYGAIAPFITVSYRFR